MLYSLLEENVGKYGDKPVMQIKRDGEYTRYTYKELWDWTRRFASRLKADGISPGDKVALWGDSVPEWGIAYLGIHFAQAIVVPLDMQYQAEVVVKLLKFAEAKAIVYAEELAEEAKQIAGQLSLQEYTMDPGEQESSLFSSPPLENFSAPEIDEDDTMSLIFTSGTTGDPKGVMLTCKNFVTNASALVNWATHEDIFICVLPLHHCYAFTGTFMVPLIAGASITYQPILKGPDIIEAIQDTDVTIMLGVPQLFTGFYDTMNDRIRNLPAAKRAIFRVLYKIARFTRLLFHWKLGKLFFGAMHERFGRKFRFFCSGGAKLDPQIAEFFWDLGFFMLEGYGLTETAPVICFTPMTTYHRGSVGPALGKAEVRIDNPDKEGVGEIVMRGPNLMKGYYQNEEATAKVIKDGWFHTGDLGYMDKEGFVYITGRAKEVIVLESGKNIYPDEVERHYEESPLIKELCVFGEKLADGRIASLSALIVPDFEEVQRRKVNSVKTEIQFQLENLSLKIPSYMRVKSFKIVSEPFPRTRLGKLKRNQIEQSFHQEYEEEKQKKQKTLSDEDRALLRNPAAEKFITRLQKMLKREETILPADSLELDLGIDSLKRMELLVILEQEFGMKFETEEAGSFLYISDILKLLPQDLQDVQIAEFSWKKLLEEEPEPALEQMFNLRRGFIKNGMIEIVRFFGRIFCRIFFGLKINNFDKILEHKSCLITPNHQSYIDAVLIYCSLPKKALHNTVFIALDQFFSKWPVSMGVRPCRIIRTASSQTAVTSLQYAAVVLEKGMNVCIFPEGQRSIDGELSPPMLGSGILACQKQVPMVPIYVEGAMSTFSRTNPGFHTAKASLDMLDAIMPLQSDQFEEKDYKAMVDQWHKTVSERMEQ